MSCKVGAIKVTEASTEPVKKLIIIGKKIIKNNGEIDVLNNSKKRGWDKSQIFKMLLINKMPMIIRMLPEIIPRFNEAKI